MLLETRDLEFRHDRPIALGAYVGHDSHSAESHIRPELAQGLKLLHHRPRLSWLAEHDVSHEKHSRSFRGLPAALPAGKHRSNGIRVAIVVADCLRTAESASEVDLAGHAERTCR